MENEHMTLSIYRVHRQNMFACPHLVFENTFIIDLIIDFIIDIIIIKCGFYIDNNSIESNAKQQ